jgi:biotin carboxylase
VVTGVDLVKSQIRIAAGEKLPEILAAGDVPRAMPSSAASTPSIRKRSRRRRAASPG